MKYKYIFYIPHYQKNSNGLAVLWEAAVNFSQFRDVTVCTFHNGIDEVPMPDKFNKLKILRGDEIWRLNLTKKHIVVYADGVQDNPFNHTNIARYLMCKPYILNGLGYNINQYDYCFAYSKAVSEILPQYNIISGEVAKINKLPHKIKTNKVVLYFGKTREGLSFKGLNNLLNNFDEIEIISRNYPATKEQMFKMISESRLLISFDSLSSICHESTLLGTPVYIYDKVFKSLYNFFNFRLHGFYYDVETKDLERIYEESIDLHIRAKNEVIKSNKTILDRTKTLLEEMEDHFINTKNCFDLYNKNMDNDRKFYKNEWEYSAIFNIVSKSSLLRYLLINKYKILGILLFIFRRLIIKLVNKPRLIWKKFSNIFVNMITFNPESYIFENVTQEEKDTLKNLLGKNKNLDSKLKEYYTVDTIKRDFATKSGNDIIADHMNINAEEIKVTKFIRKFWK